MTSIIMKEKLHRFIETIGEKRMKAIYALFENEIEEGEWEYTDEFKAELDRRYEYYMNGGKMVSAEEANRQIGALVKKYKDK